MDLPQLSSTIPSPGRSDAARRPALELPYCPTASTGLAFLERQRDHALFLRMQELNLLRLALFRLRGATDNDIDKNYEVMLRDLPDQTRRAEVKAQWQTTMRRIEGKHRIDMLLMQPRDRVVGAITEVDRLFAAMLTTVGAPLTAHFECEWKAFMAAFAGQILPGALAIPKLNEMANMALIDHCLNDVHTVTRVSLDALFPSRLPCNNTTGSDEEPEASFGAAASSANERPAAGGPANERPTATRAANERPTAASAPNEETAAASGPEDTVGPDDWTSTRLTCNPVFPRCAGARERFARALWHAPVAQMVANLLGALEGDRSQVDMETAFRHACGDLPGTMDSYGVAFVRIAGFAQHVLTILLARGTPAPVAPPASAERGGRAEGRAARRARGKARTSPGTLDRVALHGSALLGALVRLLIEVGACEALAAKAHRPNMPTDYQPPVLPARYDELLKQAVDEVLIQLWVRPDLCASDDRLLAVIQESTTFLVLAVEQKQAQEQAYQRALSERRRQRHAR